MNQQNGAGEHYRTSATPYLCARDAAAAIEFYKRAFGAVESIRLTDANGKLGHAEVTVGEARIMISDEYPEIDVRSPEAIGGSPVMIVLDVPDADAVFNRAVAAGAQVVRPMADSFGGAHRNGKLIDPFGHRWMIYTIKSDISGEELVERATGYKGTVGGGSD